jgi:hypothetical protein
LIFIPGWILLYLSINSCDDLNRRTISYKITLNEIETFRKQNKIDIQVINNQNVFLNQKIDILNKISEKINTDFTNQLDYFKYSLIVFGIWLLSYLIWFIRTDKLIEK